jgi:WD40 repeat protein
LERISTGEEIPFRIPGLPESFNLLAGGWERPAFAWWDGGIVAFDPGTGEPLGPIMTPPDSSIRAVFSVSETPDSSLAVITWWDGTAAPDETGVFDIATGELLRDGLYGLEGIRVIDGDRFIGVTEDFARIYDIRTLKPLSALARAPGGGALNSLSSDGRTLLNVGYNNALTLYDLTAKIALAGPIDSAVDATRVPGGFLTSDGESLLEALPDGIRVWDLRPADQASHACALAGRELTSEEWSTYFPGEKQVDTCAELVS